MKTNIAVIGIGYVGYANALLLSQNNCVTVFDILSSQTERLKNHPSIRIAATLEDAVQEVDFVVIAVPTDYCESEKSFDTHAVEDTVQKIIKANPNACIVIKSTVPIGFTEKLCSTYDSAHILFSPEFMREDKALYDNLHPSRIIVGALPQSRIKAEYFASLLHRGAKTDAPVFITSLSEAEAIKLFSNAYLAMRVSFFNTLDTFSETKGLHTKTVIDGICADPRIGNFYNNPSFGYGGYCLPKDTRALFGAFENEDSTLIGAVINSNQCRMQYIAEKIFAMSPPCVGIYRLNMKKTTDNFRNSAVLSIALKLIKKGIKVIAFEPLCSSDYQGIIIENDFDTFIQTSSIILANRYDAVLDDVKDKVYTRDIFFRD